MPAKSNTSPLADELLIDAEPMEPRALHRGREALWLLLALILVAINLRPALSSLAPVLRQVQTSLDLNSTAAGLLTTLPVLCLGLFAPLATRLAQRHGTERIVLRALLFLAYGEACSVASASLPAPSWRAAASASSAYCCPAL